MTHRGWYPVANLTNTVAFASYRTGVREAKRQKVEVASSKVEQAAMIGAEQAAQVPAATAYEEAEVEEVTQSDVPCVVEEGGVVGKAAVSTLATTGTESPVTEELPPTEAPGLAG